MYWAITLPPQQQLALQHFVKQFMPIPKGWDIYCEHITLAHKASLPDKEWLDIHRILTNFAGTKVAFKITGIAKNDNVLAVRVSIGTTNKHSHITIAVKEGHKPVESNELEDWQEIWSDTFEGYVTFRPK